VDAQGVALLQPFWRPCHQHTLSLTPLLSELVDQRAPGVAEDYLFVDSWVPPIPVTFGGQEWPEAARLLYFHFCRFALLHFGLIGGDLPAVL